MYTEKKIGSKAEGSRHIQYYDRFMVETGRPSLCHWVYAQTPAVPAQVVIVFQVSLEGNQD